MSEFSNYLENALIDAVLRNTTYTSPSTVYVGLFTSDPTDAGSGTEISGGSYTRKAATFGEPSNGVATNNANIVFDQATATWGVITHIGIFDALTAGNLLFHTALDTAKTIATDDIFQISSTNLTVTLS